jgi:hypothetical protein
MHSIAQDLEHFTASISNFDTERDYISMSHASLDLPEIIKTIDSGFEDSLSIRLRCYKGYQMEQDLLRRISKKFPHHVITTVEYEAYGGIVKGHPDFLFDGYPGDCKTVPLEEYLPENERRLSRKIYYQMQAYMLYGKKDKALVVMEARDTGKLRDYWLTSNQHVMGNIDDKYRQAVDYWKSRKGVISA